MGLRPKVEPADYDGHRTAFLEQIYNCVLTRSRRETIRNGPDGLRTFLDNWYAYFRKGGFLNSRGYPQWFNKSDLRQPRHRLTMQRSSKFVFISEGAWPILEGKKDCDLVKDHAVPVSLLYEELVALKPQAHADVECLLLERYQIGVLTPDENKALNDAGWRFKMPPEDCSIYARYHGVGIKRSKAMVV